jgi:hypothetical protein
MLRVLLLQRQRVLQLLLLPTSGPAAERSLEAEVLLTDNEMSRHLC